MEKFHLNIWETTSKDPGDRFNWGLIHFCEYNLPIFSSCSTTAQEAQSTLVWETESLILSNKLSPATNGAVNCRREAAPLKEVCRVLTKLVLLLSSYCASSLTASLQLMQRLVKTCDIRAFFMVLALGSELWGGKSPLLFPLIKIADSPSWWEDKAINENSVGCDIRKSEMKLKWIFPSFGKGGRRGPRGECWGMGILRKGTERALSQNYWAFLHTFLEVIPLIWTIRDHSRRYCLHSVLTGLEHLDNMLCWWHVRSWQWRRLVTEHLSWQNLAGLKVHVNRCISHFRRNTSRTLLSEQRSMQILNHLWHMMSFWSPNEIFLKPSDDQPIANN